MNYPLLDAEVVLDKPSATVYVRIGENFRVWEEAQTPNKAVGLFLRTCANMRERERALQDGAYPLDRLDRPEWQSSALLKVPKKMVDKRRRVR